MTFEMRLILEIHVVVNNLKMTSLKYWDSLTYIIPCPLSSQGLISRETNKVFSLALM